MNQGKETTANGRRAPEKSKSRNHEGHHNNHRHHGSKSRKASKTPRHNGGHTQDSHGRRTPFPSGVAAESTTTVPVAIPSALTVVNSTGVGSGGNGRGDSVSTTAANQRESTSPGSTAASATATPVPATVVITKERFHSTTPLPLNTIGGTTGGTSTSYRSGATTPHAPPPPPPPPSSSSSAGAGAAPSPTAASGTSRKGSTVRARTPVRSNPPALIHAMLPNGASDSAHTTAAAAVRGSGGGGGGAVSVTTTPVASAGLNRARDRPGSPGVSSNGSTGVGHCVPQVPCSSAAIAVTASASASTAVVTPVVAQHVVRGVTSSLAFPPAPSPSSSTSPAAAAAAPAHTAATTPHSMGSATVVKCNRATPPPIISGVSSSDRRVAALTSRSGTTGTPALDDRRRVPSSTEEEEDEDDGYYLASDGSSSLNSSFSDTAHSTLNAPGSGGGRGSRDGPGMASAQRRSSGGEHAAAAEAAEDAGGVAADSASTYDEEDEEQAVQRYMDAGVVSRDEDEMSEDSQLISGRTGLEEDRATRERSMFADLRMVEGGRGKADHRHPPLVAARRAAGGVESTSTSVVSAPVLFTPTMGGKRGDRSASHISISGSLTSPHPTGSSVSMSAPPAVLSSSSVTTHPSAASPPLLTTATSAAGATAASASFLSTPAPVTALPRQVTPTTTTPSAATPGPAPALAPEAVVEATAEGCRSLTLYDAFFLDRERQKWYVDDKVLAKCLEYVRLMGYRHPLLKRERAAGKSSMWSSSAAIPSPIMRSAPGSACADGVVRAYKLRSSPTCAAQRAGVSTLFLEHAEAMRWISEQEYVIGVILMCCAKEPAHRANTGSTGSGSGHQPQQNDGGTGSPQPCIPPHSHPIYWAAKLITQNYPHWGDFELFARMWETQVRLVLGSAVASHQRLFTMSDDGLVFLSDFEGGNLHRVERAAEPYVYNIWLEPDAGSDKRIWFRFAVSGVKEGRTLRLRLLNAAPHTKLYRQNGMVPVWRDASTQPNWTAVDQCTFRTTNDDLNGEVGFSIVPRNSVDTIQVAFCAPYTYADLLCHICNWHALVRNSVCSIRFEERVLCRTPDGRKLHLLIITSPTSNTTTRKADNNGNPTRRRAQSLGAGGVNPGSPNNNTSSATNNGNNTANGSGANGTGSNGNSGKEVVRGPYSNFLSGKKVVLISGRVHPGEVTASHGVHGIITFLLSSDPRAILLREHFLFFIVPMLNPDGVSRGHSRLDQFGNNLNRCYNEPDSHTQPTVYALRKVFEHLQRSYRDRFIMYIDFHSHASQSSGFMFGNHLPLTVQHWNMVFPKIVELHARDNFSFALCRFGKVHMTSKDGASRVLFGSSLIHSYTVELPYFSDRTLYTDSVNVLNNGSLRVFDPPVASPAGTPCGGGGNSSNAVNNGAGGCGSPSSSTANGYRGASPSPGLPDDRISDGPGSPTSGNRAASRSSRAAGPRLRANSESVAHRHYFLRRGPKGSGLLLQQPAPPSFSSSTTATNPSQHHPPPQQQQRRGHSMSAAERGAPLSVKLQRRGRAPAGDTGPSLQRISTPCIMRQPASVGFACMLGLLDYCAVGPYSSYELTVYGGIDRVLMEAKRQMKHSRSYGKKPTAYTIQPIYKQY